VQATPLRASVHAIGKARSFGRDAAQHAPINVAAPPKRECGFTMARLSIEKAKTKGLRAMVDHGRLATVALHHRK
jgi:hypothetical protein